MTQQRPTVSAKETLKLRNTEYLQRRLQEGYFNHKEVNHLILASHVVAKNAGVEDFVWKNTTITNNDFENMIFKDGEMIACDFEGTTFKNVVFKNMKLSGVNLTQCDLDNVSFIDCELRYVDANDVKHLNLLLEKSHITKSGFIGVDNRSDIQIHDCSGDGFYATHLEKGSTVQIIGGSLSGRIFGKDMNFSATDIKGGELLIAGGVSAQLSGKLKVADLSEVNNLSIQNASINKLSISEIKTAHIVDVSGSEFRIDEKNQNVLVKGIKFNEWILGDGQIGQLDFKDSKFKEMFFYDNLIQHMKLDHILIEARVYISNTQFNHIDVYHSYILPPTAEDYDMENSNVKKLVQHTMYSQPRTLENVGSAYFLNFFKG